MRTLIIMRGIPGSGKTYHAKQLGGRRVSADHHFTNEEGTYTFVPSELPKAHGACLRQAIRLAASPMVKIVVVDNTNTSAVEMAPYVCLGQAYGMYVRIVRIVAPLETCVARNVHNVPERTLVRMNEQIENERLPMWWPAEEIIENP